MFENQEVPGRKWIATERGAEQDEQRRGSITKEGVPTIRRIIVEMVWRMILFQSKYKAVQKLAGSLAWH